MIVNRSESGFALLIAVVVVGVILTVGLVILDLTIKQVRLAIATADMVCFSASSREVR